MKGTTKLLNPGPVTLTDRVRKAFDAEEAAWREAAKLEGMDLSGWVRRALDRARVAEARERRAREKWY